VCVDIHLALAETIHTANWSGGWLGCRALLDVIVKKIISMPEI
jgi:hypothetical protein